MKVATTPLFTVAVFGLLGLVAGVNVGTGTAGQYVFQECAALPYRR
jgi:hypothetical protein